MPFQIIRADISRVQADAIVNSANPAPIYGRGSDAMIYQAAGAVQLLKERRKIGAIAPGEAYATKAFALRARYIIHTVGPVWEGGSHGELETLASCYRKSLYLAKQLHCSSIAFPLISTGVYGFPKDRALAVALREIQAFLEEAEMLVTLVVFHREAYELSAGLVDEVSQYIDDHEAAQIREEEYSLDIYEAARNPEEEYGLADDGLSAPLSSLHAPGASMPASPAPSAASGGGFANAAPAKKRKYALGGSARRDLKDVIEQVGETFQEKLLRLIDERGLTDAQVYKKANLDRKLFSKIRKNKEYHPSKATALAFAVALGLNLDETADLLGRAGFALSPSSRFDLIVSFCIEHEMDNIMDVNAILFEYEQPLLGA